MPADTFTARELAVLRMLAAGRSNRAIASELVTSLRHLAKLYDRLGLHSKGEAVAFAIEHGLLGEGLRTED